jgi:hypothetical protein
MLPGALRAHHIDFLEDGGLDGNRPAAEDHSHHQQPQGVVPFHPVKRDQQPPNATEQLQRLRREPLNIEGRVAEQPVAVIQRTAQLPVFSAKKGVNHL